jgi:hypothetical protein
MKLLLFRFSFLTILAILPVTLLAQTGKIDSVAAQSALVTEFDVNGLKVILKRRASAPTYAAGLFIRGGARNITAANAGVENFALTAATEAGTKYPRQALPPRVVANRHEAFGVVKQRLQRHCDGLDPRKLRPYLGRFCRCFDESSLCG